MIGFFSYKDYGPLPDKMAIAGAMSTDLLIMVLAKFQGHPDNIYVSNVLLAGVFGKNWPKKLKNKKWIMRAFNRYYWNSIDDRPLSGREDAESLMEEEEEQEEIEVENKDFEYMYV